MAIQRRFLLVASVFIAVSASGSLAPVGAASFWPDGANGFSSVIDQAAVPAPVDDRLRPDLLVEQWLDGVGSVAEQEAASETEPLGVDPWADAYAESSRAAVVSVPRKSAYPVSMNPQVQYFLDRFTGARRDVVNLWVGRSGRYLGMIREVLKNRGLPEELGQSSRGVQDPSGCHHRGRRQLRLLAGADHDGLPRRHAPLRAVHPDRYGLLLALGR